MAREVPDGIPDYLACDDRSTTITGPGNPAGVDPAANLMITLRHSKQAPVQAAAPLMFRARLKLIVPLKPDDPKATIPHRAGRQPDSRTCG